MSRKYMEDNGIKAGPTADIPPTGYPAFRPGFLFLNTDTAKLYRNVGVQGDDLYTDEFTNRWTLEERFIQRPGINADRDAAAANTYATATCQLNIDKNPNFEVLGTNAVSSCISFADGGGVTMTTTTAANDQVILAPHLNSNATAWAAAKWNTLDRVIFETVIKTGASITATSLWAGLKLTNTSVTATDNDQAFFRYDDATNSGKVQLVISNAGTDTVINSGLALAVSTSYHLMIRVDSNRKPHFYINGTEYGLGSLVALASDVDLIPYVGVQTTTTAAKAATCRGFRCSKMYND